MYSDPDASRIDEITAGLYNNSMADSTSIAEGLRTPNTRIFKLVYINLHEVYKFDLLIKGFNRYLKIAQFEKE